MIPWQGAMFVCEDKKEEQLYLVRKFIDNFYAI